MRRQKLRDRATNLPAEKTIRFVSNILPRWARRSRSLDARLAVLHLRAISTGDVQEALAALLGRDARPGPLALGDRAAIGRRSEDWQADHDRWPLARPLGPPSRLHAGRRGPSPGADGG